MGVSQSVRVESREGLLADRLVRGCCETYGRFGGGEPPLL
jgi:hypothetical protein